MLPGKDSEAVAPRDSMMIAILGAGGHAQVVVEILQQRYPERLEIVLFDDRWEQMDRPSGGAIRGPISSVSASAGFDGAIVAIGDNRARRAIQQRLEAAGLPFLTAIHPHTAISPHAQFGTGTVAIAGVVANFGCSVGRGVILNTLSSVGHDCRVGDFAQLAPGVNLGGSSQVGEGVFLGIGAKVGPGVQIGDWSIVGAGSVVLDDLPARHFCKGIPAQPIRALGPAEVPAS